MTLPTVPLTGKPPGRYRWVICALLFFATTINYIDRQVLGILKPTLSTQLGWNEIDYSNIILFFQLAYAFGYLLAGRMMDRLGVRRGFALVVFVWSLAAMSHGLVNLIPAQAAIHLATNSGWQRLLALGLYGSTTAAVYLLPWTVVGFCAARFALGISEGGNFPAAIKTVSEWHPRKERALATGIFNAGSNLGALLTPLAVPWITVTWGWPAAFFATGALGLVWLVAWLTIYRPPQEHPRLLEAERAYILSDPADPPVHLPWLSLLRYKQTWAFAIGMFMTSPVWWFYLYWLPSFLHDKHGLDLLHLGPPLITIYLVADVGSIGGGWLSSRLLAQGWTVNAARKTTLLICALCVLPVFFAANIASVWWVTAIIALAAAAHQGFSANLYTLVSDTAPRQAIGAVVGIGGMAGAVGGMLIAKVVGFILQWTHGSYVWIFGLAASAYLVALTIMHLLNPRLEPMNLTDLPVKES